MEFITNDGYMACGKYGPEEKYGPTGATLEWVCRNDPGYLEWVISKTDCCDEDIWFIQSGLALVR